MHQNLKILNKDELYEEIYKSKKILENNLNKKIEHFSIPFGTKNAFSSETDKIMLGTTFSHYLGIKQCRKPKIKFFFCIF